jgi:thiamine pyrophosphokinase
MNIKNKSKKGQTALVITGGEAPLPAAVAPFLRDYDFLIAADSGLDRVLEYGLTPDLIMGDMDSLQNFSFLDNFDKNKVRRYPPEKDYTDTELALREIVHYDKKILIGGGEGRLDHTLALLALFKTNYSPDLWITAREMIFPVHGTLTIEGDKGQLISFYPLGKDDIFFESEGLQWPLNCVNWESGEMSLSNRFTGNSVKLIQIKGDLLVIQSLSNSPA